MLDTSRVRRGAEAAAIVGGVPPGAGAPHGAMHGAPLLELRGIVRAWRAGDARCGAIVRALRGLDFLLHAGELVALAGAAGAGKSTLLLCAAGLARVDAGTVGGVGAGRVAYVGPASEWARRAMAAVDRGAMVLLLDVLDAPALASPRAVAALAGGAAAAGLAVVVASRDAALLPAFASRLVVLERGRVAREGRPFEALRAARDDRRRA
jgi:ABC-type branched-subunit amino acid transport system ATPase component